MKRQNHYRASHAIPAYAYRQSFTPVPGASDAIRSARPVYEFAFTELGYFTEKAVQRIAKAMNGKTYMCFEVTSSNQAGNRTLIVRTSYSPDPDEVKKFFLTCALAELADRVS